MIKRVLTLALVAAPAVLAFAQDEVSASVVEKFRTMHPKTTFKEIRRSQAPGSYETVMGENITYTDESGHYLILEHLFDMQQQVNLTVQRKLDSKETEFPTQQLGQAIKTAKGDGGRILVVFSNSDCSYCRQLEGELTRLDNVIICTSLYPLESLHPEAKTKVVSVQHAPNKAKAWSELMLTGKESKLVACNNPVNGNLALGFKLGVVSTPTLIVTDGRVLPSSASAEKIDQWPSADRPGAPTAAQGAT